MSLDRFIERTLRLETRVWTMRLAAQRLIRMVVVLVVVVGLPVLGFKGIPQLKEWWDREHPHVESTSILAEKAKPRGTLVGADAKTLRLPQEVVETLQVQTAEVQPALMSDTLKLEGSLFLDANRLVHVSPRFSGDVIELGQIEGTASDQIPTSEKQTTSRSVSFGDNVRKGQLLAVIWSKELGEKKSELIEALTTLRFDEEKLKRLEESFAKGAVPERTVLDAKHEIETDIIAIARVERTLRSWRLNTEQIQTIRREAERVRAHKGDWHDELDDTWARVEIKAPMDGTIVEKNVAVGDFVGTDLDLFKIADLRRLDVLAHIYEEDISLLEALPLGQRRWAIRLNAEQQSQPLEGSFQRIGNLIDPAQHTALVMGWVDNSAGRLRAGQFISAQVTLPPDPDEVVIPLSALVDLEGESRVFVETDSGNHEFTLRRVRPTRRRNQFVFVSSKPRDVLGQLSIDTLHVGERVVTAGGVEMAAELEALRAAARTTVSMEATAKNTP